MLKRRASGHMACGWWIRASSWFLADERSATLRRSNLSEGETDDQGNDEWDEIVLKALLGSVDMHSIHFYTCLGHEKVKDAAAGLEYERNVFGPAVSS